MPKNDLSIEIVSAKNVLLSSMSDRSRKAIAKILSKYYNNVRITLVGSQSDLDKIIKRKPDAVVLGVKRIHTNSKQNHIVWVADYLREHGIATTGSTSKSHFLELNKEFAKREVREHGIVTADSVVYKRNEPGAIRSMLSTFPQFVKPANNGGGEGIDEESLVRNNKELSKKVMKIFKDPASDALVELFLPGREFSVAMLMDPDTNYLHAMPLEIKATNKNRILTLEEKRQDKEEVFGVEDGEIRENVVQLAKDSFRAIGASDYGRIDIRLDANNKAHFLEANLIPGIKGTSSYFSRACRAHLNIEHEAMIMRIVDLALLRKASVHTEAQRGISISTAFAF